MKLGWVAIASFAILAVGCGGEKEEAGVIGSGKRKVDTRKVAAFDKIEAEGMGRLEVTVGEKESLVIDMDENLVSLVTSTVENGTLKLAHKGAKPTTMTYKITLPKLTAVTTHGAVEGRIDKIDSPKFEFITNGTGGFFLTGKADEATFTFNGEAGADAFNFVVKKLTVTTNGIGNAEVNATETMNATINGAGGIAYRGKPKVTQAIHGAGTIVGMD